MTRTSLFKSNRSQALRLPKAVAFPEGVREVDIRIEGNRRVLSPAGSSWDDFFARPGIDLGPREQPEYEVREEF